MFGTRLPNSDDVKKNGFTDVTLRSTYTKDDDDKKYEEYYYMLNEDDMNSLSIEKGDDSRISNEVTPKNRSYIVNYLTGEIFDVASKKYYKTDIKNDDLVYTQPTQINMVEKYYNFSDD